MQDNKMSFEAYAYRTSSRFGSRVIVAVSDATVSVTGPRIGEGAYRAWIATQAMLLALVPVALVAAVVARSGWWVLGAVALLALHAMVGGFGAGCLWELQNLIDLGKGRRGETVEFPVGAVQEVKIGAGWGRRLMWLMLLPYFRGIDSMAKGMAVSFVAPDGSADGGVYALHLRAPEEAQELARLLGGPF